MKFYALLLIFLLLIVVFMIGCKSTISNNDDWPEFKEKYLGKKFIIKSEFFLVKFSDEIIKENVIFIPSDISGYDIYPTRKQFLDNPQSTYIGGKSKILSIENRNHSFVVKHIMYYRKDSSNNFLYFILESMDSKQKFTILETTYSVGINEGFIQIIE